MADSSVCHPDVCALLKSNTLPAFRNVALILTVVCKEAVD